MNIDTGEIRNLNDLSDAEKASGKWVPVSSRKVRDSAFNGRHRVARVEAFAGLQARKAKVAKSRKAMKRASQRKNRAAK